VVLILGSELGGDDSDLHAQVEDLEEVYDWGGHVHCHFRWCKVVLPISLRETVALHLQCTLKNILHEKTASELHVGHTLLHDHTAALSIVPGANNDIILHTKYLASGKKSIERQTHAGKCQHYTLLHNHSCILLYTVWLNAGVQVLVCQTYRQCRERGWEGCKVSVAPRAPAWDLKSSLLFSDAKFATVQPSHIYLHT